MIIKDVNQEDCCWYCSSLDEYSFANDCECAKGHREPFDREEAKVGVCKEFDSYLD